MTSASALAPHVGVVVVLVVVGFVVVYSKQPHTFPRVSSCGDCGYAFVASWWLDRCNLTVLIHIHNKNKCIVI